MQAARGLLFALALLLCWGGRLLAATEPTEQSVFRKAVGALQDGWYKVAEETFKDFSQKYTNSPHLPEALLGQAQAQIKQTNYTAAISLLSSNQTPAMADQFLFWLAEAYFGQGEYLRAAETFARLAKDFPNSSRRLEAVVGEASARSKLADWRGVLALLQPTNGWFQLTARTNAGTNEHVFHGQLLLGEAYLAQQDYAAAETNLLPLGSLLLPTSAAWRWNYLFGRIRLAQNRLEDALRNATNMISLSAEARQPVLRGDSVAFEAGILERLNRLEEAIATYLLNLSEGTPPDRQRQALLKITELRLLQHRVPDAIQTLKKYLEHPGEPAAEIAWLSLGELQLRQFVSLVQTNGSTNSLSATNYLLEAQGSLQALTTNFPQGQLFGKAQLDLGWCYWLQNKMPESQKAFQSAADRLAASPDQATAFFKLADAQFRQSDFTNALANYKKVTEKFVQPEIRTNLFEPAWYQQVRAALAAHDLLAASNALGRLLADYPKGFHTEHAFLVAGVQMIEMGKPEAARRIFLDFIAAAPDSRLMPEVRLAVARSFEQQEMWPEAIGQYEPWLTTYTNHEKIPAALYYAARANFFARRETNAFSLYTNLLARFPASEFAPMAQWCVGMDYFGKGDYQNAETSFQLLFKKWPHSDLAWQAQMMAARMAFARKSWKDTITYLTNLTSDVQHCPTDLWIEAMFAYGDTLVSQESSNKIADYAEAIQVYKELCRQPATNRGIDRAWGALANCYLQWAMASRQYDALSNAVAAFQTVLQSPRADPAARSIAAIGLGVVLEIQAERKTDPGEQLQTLRFALTNYLQVFYGGDLRENEKPDLHCVKKAGVEAARLAERLQEWRQAVNVYQRMKELLPPMAAFFETRIRKAQEHLSTAKVP